MINCDKEINFEICSSDWKNARGTSNVVKIKLPFTGTPVD
jgi:hypothetical protein